jgi:hypothetical protein
MVLLLKENIKVVLVVKPVNNRCSKLIETIRMSAFNSSEGITSGQLHSLPYDL